MTDKKLLLDFPPYPPEAYAGLADRLKSVLRTQNDVLFVQGEAIIALEATAASLAGSTIHALNIVTSPYGRWFGEWLRRGGAVVADLEAKAGLPIKADAVAQALKAWPSTNLVAMVHAESASGILNPLPEIARLARANGALLVVDAVASVGGHELDVDALGVDIAVIGPQKALGGPSGISALSISRRAWQIIDRHDAPVQSVLSLMDLKRNWLDIGRGVLPGMPSALEFHALEAALDKVDEEGVDVLIARHALAARATRSGLRALGASLWIEPDKDASNLVTAVRVHEDISSATILRHPDSVAAGLDEAVGAIAGRVIRLNHTGPRARREIVRANVLAFGQALRAARLPADLDAAEAAIAQTYR